MLYMLCYAIFTRKFSVFLNYLNSDILRKNGSAADATVAGLFCVGVINTQSMGLGGGFLLTYYERSTGKAYTLDARETAPGAAYEDMYHGEGDLMQIGKRMQLTSLYKIISW